MKKLVFSIVFYSLFFAELSAQTLERQVIGASGDYNTAAWGSLSYTTGEAMTNTFTSTSLVLTQGFQQPLQGDLEAQSIYFGIPSIDVYPNPAGDKINIVITSGNLFRKYTVAIFDLLGQKINAPSEINCITKNVSITFDLQHLASAPYFIVVSDDHGDMIKIFKITKTK